MLTQCLAVGIFRKLALAVNSDEMTLNSLLPPMIILISCLDKPVSIYILVELIVWQVVSVVFRFMITEYSVRVRAIPPESNNRHPDDGGIIHNYT